MTKEELLTMDVLSLQNLVAKLQKEKQALDQNIERLYANENAEKVVVDQRISYLHTSIHLKTVERDSLDSQIENKREILRGLESEEKQTNENLGVLSSKFKLVSDEIVGKEFSLKGLEEEYKKRKDRMMDDLVQLQSKISSHTLDIERLKKSKTVLEDDHSALHHQIVTKTSEHEKLKGHVESMRTRREVLAEHILKSDNKRLLAVNKKLEAMAQDKRKK